MFVNLHLYIIVNFFVGAQSISYRLMDGREDGTSGRVEVYYGGTWGTVCDDKWDVLDAIVVCNSLGMSTTNPMAYPCSKYGSASGTIQLSQLSCTGSEASIDMCPHSTSTGGCGHNEDAGVDCAPSESVADTLRLVGGNEYSGKVQVRHNGVWGTVCSSTAWGVEEAKVVCNQLGLGSDNAIAYIAGAQSGDPIIWYDNINCDGTEHDILQCSSWGPRCPPYTASCGHSNDMGVTCDPVSTTTVVTTIETTIDTTVETTIDTTIETTLETTVGTTLDTTINTSNETTIETTADTSLETTTKTTIQATLKTTIDSSFETTETAKLHQSTSILSSIPDTTTTKPLNNTHGNGRFAVINNKTNSEQNNDIKPDKEKINLVEDPFTASDKRASATAIGSFGILLLIAAALILIVSDAKILYSHIKKMLHNIGIYEKDTVKHL